MHRFMRTKTIFQIIYADPPWDVMRGPDFNSNGISRPLPYNTMSILEIKTLPVMHVVADNAVLFLWTINKYICEAYDIARAWSFRPVALLTYCKPPRGLGLGGTFTQTSEHLLFARRGTLVASKRVDTTWFQQPRLKQHSQKPKFFRHMITDVFGELPRLELFARNKSDGWETWGNDERLKRNLQDDINDQNMKLKEWESLR